ncbi:MAG: DUF3137 domain-containing protein [Bacteroidales bacterium]|nr:DUF3137 domain-containing protein [Bacteroidales bacterium]
MNNINYQTLETKRKEILKQNKKGFVKGAFYGGIILIVGGILSALLGFIGIVIIVIGLFVFFIVWILQNLKINKKIRAQLYSELTKTINPEFEYSFGEKQLIWEMSNSGFVPKSSNKFVDDAFKIKIAENEAIFGEITVKHIQGNDYLHDFIGVFGFMKLRKNYSFTVIYPHDERKEALRINFLEKNADKSKLNKQKMSLNSEFDKIYSVWTNNPGEAEKILNENLVKLLTEKSANQKLFVAFRDQKMYLGIDAFQPFKLNINKPITEKSAKDFYLNFKKVTDLFSRIYNSL